MIGFFVFWLIIISVLFQSDGMVFEKPVSRLSHLAIRSNSLKLATRSVENVRSFSEALLKPRRNFYEIETFPVFSKKNDYRDHKKSWRFGLLAAGTSISFVGYNKSYAEEDSNSFESKKRDLTDKELGECLLEGRNRIDADYKRLENNKKKIVLLIGNTGEGKTSLSLFLTGKQPVFKEINGDKIVCFPDVDSSLVGHDQDQSCTIYPKLFLNNDIVLWDCPGFLDSRGDNYKLAANVFLDYLTKQRGDKSFVIVVTDSSLGGGGGGNRGGVFTNLIDDISKIFAHSREELFSEIPGEETLLDSLVWVITKPPEKRKPEHMQAILTNKSRTFADKIADLAKLLSSKDSKASDSIEKRLDTQRKEKLLTNACKKNNVLLTFKNPDKERKDILSQIKKSKSVVDVKSAFVDSKQKEKLEKIAEKTFVHTIELDQKINEIKRHKDDLNEIIRLKNEIQSMNLFSLSNAIDREIEIIRNKIKESNQRYLEFKKDLDELLQKDKEEVLVYEPDDFFERRTRLLPGVLNFRYATPSFYYENRDKPFIKIVMEKDKMTQLTSCKADDKDVLIPFSPTENGHFTHGEAEREKRTVKLKNPASKFYVTGEGPTGRECRVSLKLYGERSKLAITGVVKKINEENLKKIEDDLKKLDIEIKVYRNIKEIAQTKGLQEAQKKFTAEVDKGETDLSLKQRLRELEVEEERLIKEMNKQKDIGCALLVIGPEYIHENTAAKNFKKQFMVGSI